MIFVTVGTQLPFDRLIRAVDAWADAKAHADVFAQVGDGGFTPMNIDSVPHLRPTLFEHQIQDASVVVAHAGMGTILTCLDLGKPLLILPRRSNLGEHRNDHQLATAARFCRHPSIRVAEDEEQIAEHLDALLKMKGTVPLVLGMRLELIEEIRAFVGQ